MNKTGLYQYKSKVNVNLDKKRTLILQYTFVFVFSDKEQNEINGKIITLKVFSPLTKETIESKDE